jgi:hypothetical protein
MLFERISFAKYKGPQRSHLLSYCTSPPSSPRNESAPEVERAADEEGPIPGVERLLPIRQRSSRRRRTRSAGNGGVNPGGERQQPPFDLYQHVGFPRHARQRR